MGKTISEQIEELQNENTRLKNLEKLFDKMVKTDLGMDLKSTDSWGTQSDWGKNMDKENEHLW